MAPKRARTEANVASNKKKTSASDASLKKSRTRIAMEEENARLKTQIALNKRVRRLESRISELNSYQTKYNLVLEIMLAAWARAILEALQILPPTLDMESDDDEEEIDNVDRSVGKTMPQAVMLDLLQKWAKAIKMDSDSDEDEEKEKEKYVNPRKVEVPCSRNLSLEEHVMKLEANFALLSSRQINLNAVLEILLWASVRAVGVDVEALPSFPQPPAYFDDDEEESDEEEED